MTTSSIKMKAVSLCFRGFNMAPNEVEALVGLQASRILERGKPIKPGIKTLAVRSAVGYKVTMESHFRLAEMIPKLFDHLGGVTHLINVQNAVQAEFLEINFVLPIKRSEEQEGGALEMETIADLARLGASVSFEFL